MLISLHRNATTMPAIREAIRKATGSDHVLARQFNVTRDTIRKWRRRDTVQDASHTAHRLQTTLNAGQDDLPPCSPTRARQAKSAHQENGGHEEQQVQRGTDHWVPQAGRGRNAGGADLSHGRGFSDATFCKWRARFGGMQASDAKRLRELESENARLKELLAEAHLDMHALKSVPGVERQPHGTGARRSAG